MARPAPTNVVTKQSGPFVPPERRGTVPPLGVPPGTGGIRTPPPPPLDVPEGTGGIKPAPPSTPVLGANPIPNGGIKTAGAQTSGTSAQVGQDSFANAAGGAQTATGTANPPADAGNIKQPPQTADAATTAPVVTIPAAQAGPIVDDLSKINHGAPVSNKPGWNWYHTGAGGWVQAQSDPKAAPAGAGGPPKTPAEAMEAKLLELLNGPSPEEVGAGAGDSAQARAYRAGQQRNQERTRAQLAEENAVGGGDVSNPGLERAIRGLDQQAGESEGQFVAQLAGQMMQDRRAELMQAMQMQAAKGDAEAARQTQMAIAQLDAEVRRRGYDVQESLGGRDLDLRKMLGLAGLANERYDIDTTRDTNRDRLGFDFTELLARLNESGYKSLTG